MLTIHLISIDKLTITDRLFNSNKKKRIPNTSKFTCVCKKRTCLCITLPPNPQHTIYECVRVCQRSKNMVFFVLHILYFTFPLSLLINTLMCNIFESFGIESKYKIHVSVSIIAGFLFFISIAHVWFSFYFHFVRKSLT